MSPRRLDAKRDAFEQLNRCCRDDAILTSTTSSILVTHLAALVKRPERFLNIHWLNPAYVIPVVELSTHAGTSPEVLARAKALLESIGKLPVVCGPTPGYIVPRLQALVMNEAARMIEEGAATAEEIDKATRYGLGLRFAALGVVEFIDFGGSDILHHASREMSASIDAARYRAPAIVDRMVAEGRLGLKTGSGFYDYEGRDLGAYRADVLRARSACSGTPGCGGRRPRTRWPSFGARSRPRRRSPWRRSERISASRSARMHASMGANGLALHPAGDLPVEGLEMSARQVHVEGTPVVIELVEEELPRIFARCRRHRTADSPAPASARCSHCRGRRPGRPRRDRGRW